jgi:alkylation response protein AidB-like acyl-CoA dehydrogenase
MMANFYEDNDDLRWYVERGGVDWEPLVRLTEYGFRAEGGHATTSEAVDFYKDVLNMVGAYIGDEIAPRWRELDDAHPHLDEGEVVEAEVTREVFEGVKALELHGLCVPRELGGMNAPLLLLHINGELFCRADVSVGAHQGFHGGIAMAALSYSVREGSTEFALDPPRITSCRFEECIREICAGEAWGSMDITEPDAGSDMAALRCRGELDADGTWRVTGQKIYITSGHGKWHFVIARTEPDEGKTAGLEGLSMFLVPAYTTGPDGERVRHSTIDGVETKLGHNGSATVAISFDRSPALLVGKRGEGFKLMLVLMNNARVGVGFESIGVSEAAYRAAVDYARQRPSMGKTIDQHEMIAEKLEAMRTDIQAMRAMCITAGWHSELAEKYDLFLRFTPPADAREREHMEQQLAHHRAEARLLTPLLKWFSAERAVDICRDAIQVHGGAGYTKDYPVEKLLRDAMVFPIYEGTTQIQALMTMKDHLMAAVKDPAAFVRQTARARWESLRAPDPMARRVAHLRLNALQAIGFLLSRLAGSKVRELRLHNVAAWQKVLTAFDPKRDFALAMLHADRLASLLTDATVAELLLQQAQKDASRADLLVRWLERSELRSNHVYEQITRTGGRLLSTLGRADDASAEAAK